MPMTALSNTLDYVEDVARWYARGYQSAILEGDAFAGVANDCIAFGLIIRRLAESGGMGTNCGLGLGAVEKISEEYLRFVGMDDE